MIRFLTFSMICVIALTGCTRLVVPVNMLPMMFIQHDRPLSPDDSTLPLAMQTDETDEHRPGSTAPPQFLSI